MATVGLVAGAHRPHLANIVMADFVAVFRAAQSLYYYSDGDDATVMTITSVIFKATPLPPPPPLPHYDYTQDLFVAAGSQPRCFATIPWCVLRGDEAEVATPGASTPGHSVAPFVPDEDFLSVTGETVAFVSLVAGPDSGSRLIVRAWRSRRYFDARRGIYESSRVRN